MQRAQLERALELKRSGSLDEAGIALEALLADEPGNALALAHLAQIQLRRRRPADALAELEKAEAAGGATAFTARVRGDALYRLGRHRQAPRAFEEADALGDRDARTMAQPAVEREPEAAVGWGCGATSRSARATRRSPRSASSRARPAPGPAEVRGRWRSGPAVTVVVATAVDEPLHHTPVELAALLDESVVPVATPVAG